MDTLMRIEEAATALDVSAATIRRYLDKKKLDAVQLPGRGLRVTRESLAALLARRPDAREAK